MNKIIFILNSCSSLIFNFSKISSRFDMTGPVECCFTEHAIEPHLSAIASKSCRLLILLMKWIHSKFIQLILLILSKKCPVLS